MRTSWMVDLDDTGSSVYPEARANPWSWEDEPDTERYIFGDNAMELLEKARKILKERYERQHEV